MKDDKNQGEGRQPVVIRIEVGPRVVRIARALAAPFRRRRLAAWAAVAALGLAVYATAQPVGPAHEFEPGTPIRAADMNEMFQEIYDALSQRVIREPETWTVTADAGCEGLVDALARLDGRTIATPATVTIELQPGTYECEERILFSHPDGQRVHIVGTGPTPAGVTLTFPGAGIRVADGYHLGLLENVTLQGGGESAEGGHGLHVSAGGKARARAVIAQDFNGEGFRAWGHSFLRLEDAHSRRNSRHGIEALYGSTLILVAPFIAEANGSVGIRASASTIVCEGVDAETAIRSQSNVVDGFYLTSRSSAVCNVQAESNGRHGAHVLHGSLLRSTGAGTSYSDNTSHGVAVGERSTALIWGSASSIEDNGGNGLFIARGSYARIANEVTVGGNTAGDFNMDINTVTVNGTIQRN
jgi:hypothetical protein